MEDSQHFPPVQDRKSGSNIDRQEDRGKDMQVPEQVEPIVSGSWLVEVLEDCFVKDVQHAMDTVLSSKAQQVQSSVEVIQLLPITNMQQMVVKIV